MLLSEMHRKERDGKETCGGDHKRVTTSAMLARKTTSVFVSGPQNEERRQSSNLREMESDGYSPIVFSHPNMCKCRSK